MTLNADEVRAYFERRDREHLAALPPLARSRIDDAHAARAAQLIEQWGGARADAHGVSKAHRRLNRTSPRDAYKRAITKRWRDAREPVLNSEAFGRVLAAFPADGESVEAAARIVDLVCWSKNNRLLMREHGPAEALGLATTKQSARAELLEILEHFDERFRAHTGADQSISPTRTLRESVVPDALPITKHLWTGGLTASHFKRGTTATWRGVIVRTLDAQLPNVQRRHTTIAALVQLGGDETITHRHVASILRADR